ncbi:hypothetical protein GUJ93_ZPchr1554g46485, partial [Zizania palustris]
PEGGTSTLAAELLTGDLELQANLKTIYILDSFHSKSREPVICRILTTLKQLLGSDYISEVLEVQQQENNYDCGFHVLLYINGFNDKKTEQICGVNKDMVEKCRIETSVHLRRHKLNKPAEVIIDDDDDVEVLENIFSYDNCIFNAALRGESTHSFMDRTGTFLPGFEINVDGADMDNSKLESNVDGKKPSQEQQPEDSSTVMKSHSERQLKPPSDFSLLHDKRICQYIKFEVLENAYKLAMDWTMNVLEEKIQGALPFLKRKTTRATTANVLEDTILRDEFVKRVKFGIVQYLLCHKKNRGEVPDTVIELLSK